MKKRLKEIEGELKRMKDLKEKQKQLILEKDRLESLKKNLQDEPAKTVAHMKAAKVFYKK